MQIGVVDYGFGNLGSILGALAKMGETACLIDDPARLDAVDRIILPGVGNFGDCIAALNTKGWSEALEHVVISKGRPLLGICIGMQLLADTSTEISQGMMDNQLEDSFGVSIVNGLGFIPGHVKSLRSQGCSHRIPHIGWNSVLPHEPGNDMFADIPENTDFYFVHSYVFVADTPELIAASVKYDVQVTAAVRKGHIWGTQFHPEKSSRAGYVVMRNFLKF